MKDAILNIKLSQQLYDKVKSEAERYGVTMAAFVRAALARQVFGASNAEVLGEEYTVVDKNGAYVFEMGPVKGKKAE
jgi:hypothetical protein